MRYFNALTLCLAVTLTACGGGGGGASTPDPVDPSSFALQSGFRARIQAGSTDTLGVTGDCQGTATLTSAPSVSTTFEGVAAHSAPSTSTITFTNCLPASSTATSLSYYDANFTPMGSIGPGTEYAVFESAPTAIPTTARVGDTAQVSALAVYSDSTKTTRTGRRVMSYAIEPDTATTALLNLITKSYNAAGELITTHQTRYRIAANGSLTLVSIDLQYSTISTMHLLMTKS